MNYQCSNEFILALRDLAQICEENNTDNLRLSFDISDNRELCVYISFEVKEYNDDKKPTNGDRIRSMSDEEFAEFWLKHCDNPIMEFNEDICDLCDIYENESGEKCDDDYCKNAIVKWLRSEAEKYI